MVTKFLMVGLVCVAACLRLYGLNWDQGQHLHPDERFLTMVGTSLVWPDNISEYFDTATSQLNPHNKDFGFYVYGTWPVIAVKFVAGLLSMDDYAGLTLVGRAMSAMLDVGILVLVMAIARKIISPAAALWAGVVYAAAVLPIQLAHYFATDPYAIICVVSALYFLISFIRKPTIFGSALMGMAFGLALGAKVSSVVFLPTIILGFVLAWRRQWKHMAVWLASGLVFGIAAYMSLRISMPYLFADGQVISWTLNPRVVANLKELKSYDNPEGYFPPATMWVHAVDYVFPLENMAWWGWGVPLFAIGILALVVVPMRYRNKTVWLIGFGVVSIFAYQGAQYAKPLRYFYVIYPLMAVLMGILLAWFIARLRKLGVYIAALSIIVIMAWPLAFVRIYSQDHSRVTASRWLYERVAPGVNLSCEHWDDCLPLNLEGYPGNGSYTGIEMQMFNIDEPKKWLMLADRLTETEYLILSSNRVYGSTMSVPEKFPGNTIFYTELFAGRLGFRKVREFVSRPGFFIPGVYWCLYPPVISYGAIARTTLCDTEGLSFVDDYADETFTVYDHPKVLIFQKVSPLDYHAEFTKLKLL